MTVRNSMAPLKHFKYVIPGRWFKGIQNYVIDVPHLPGHQIRIFESCVDLREDPPVVEGVVLIEAWNRAIADYVNGCGRGIGYLTWRSSENDEIHVQRNLITHEENPEQGSLRRSIALDTIVGGIGKFKG